MDKNTILEAAQKNKSRGEEFEFHKERNSYLMSYAASIIIGMILFVIDYFINSILNTSLMVIGVVSVGSNLLFTGITFKKLWKIILGSILLVVALMIILCMVIK